MKLTISQVSGSLSLTTTPGDPVHIGVQTTTPTPIEVAVPGSLSGPEGPPGPQGPQGIPGSGANTYVFTQSTPAATWTITHNLATFPSIVVVDSGGTVVEGSITHNSANACTVTFSAAFAGTAYLI